MPKGGFSPHPSYKAEKIVEGYIKMYRKLLESSYASKPNYGWVWVNLLLMANHKEKKFVWNGREQTLKPGQLLTGRDRLSEQTGVPTSTLEDILTFFEKRQHQIRQQKSTKFRIITIVNWKKYQIDKQSPTSKATTEQQQSNNRATQTRMNKNEKKRGYFMPGVGFIKSSSKS